MPVDFSSLVARGEVLEYAVNITGHPAEKLLVSFGLSVYFLLMKCSKQSELNLIERVVSINFSCILHVWLKSIENNEQYIRGYIYFFLLFLPEMCPTKKYVVEKERGTFFL
jgi:hypothetical protein